MGLDVVCSITSNFGGLLNRNTNRMTKKVLQEIHKNASHVAHIDLYEGLCLCELSAFSNDRRAIHCFRTADAQCDSVATTLPAKKNIHLNYCTKLLLLLEILKHNCNGSCESCCSADSARRIMEYWNYIPSARISRYALTAVSPIKSKLRSSTSVSNTAFRSI